MKIRAPWLVVVPAAAMFASGAHAMQDRVAVQAVRVLPDTVELGGAFTLRANVHVPPSRDLRVPATLLPEWGVESLRRVRTDVVEAGDGSLQVVLEYDLIPFEVGLAATPQLEMTSREVRADGERFRVEDGPEDGRPVGAGATQDARDARDGARTGQPVGVEERPGDRLVVAGRRVFVTSPVLLDDIARGLQPRPPADVVGSSWNLPAVLGASLLSLLLLGVVTAQTRAWVAVRAAAAVGVEDPPETPEEWRERALAELDRVLALGHHREGRLRDFYEGVGDVVRAYMAHFDPAWGRSRTSTELMRDLTAAAGWPDPGALGRAMGRGEVAKFSGSAATGVRPAVAETAATAGGRENAAAAERDWRTMRAWVEASGRAPAFARMHAEIAGEVADETAADDPDRDGQPHMPRNAERSGASATEGDQ